ncbi:aldehyde dehydrogenase family protein [Aeromicrobium sp. UC242_57]|uniref:aldehyde dehydrogenase family protein n=1 Tax=Aeromicrobium sp. UC242_57 TaxID=3374624 RepID=UPI00379BE565
MGNVPLDIINVRELFIGSRWQKPATDATFEVTSPHSGESIALLPEAAIADAQVAVDAAARVWDEGGWADLAPSVRAEFAQRWLDALRAKFDELSTANAGQTGMPLTLAEAMTDSGIVLVEDALALASTIEFVEHRDTATGAVELHREAIGPTLVIGTYNGPVSGLGMSVVPALIMGNPVILEPPPENYLIGAVIAATAAEVGFPEGVLSIFAADAEVSKFLVAHERVSAVHFTGGTKIGAEVAAVAASRIARVTLELGGKTAAIVANDADFDEVLPILVGGAVANQGQMCIASSRILVSNERHDELVARLVESFEALEIGDPLDPKTQFGPLAAERVRERSLGFIERAVAAGATLEYGGDVPEGLTDGYYLRPALLTNVKNSMEIAQEEVFGPVYSVIRYDDIDDAVSIANDSKYGLYGTIFTKDADVAHQVSSKVRVGQFSIGGRFPSLAAPYGGMKQSGYGRVGGVEGMLEMSNIKVVLPAVESGASV